MDISGKKLISIVVPIFNEEESLLRFYQSLRLELDRNSKYLFNILFVDDGSGDESCSIVNAIAEKDASVQIIGFSRNFGKEAATSAGIHHASGDAVILIDADLQHPVSKISEFLEKWESGFKVVVGVRTFEKDRGIFRDFGSRLFGVGMRLFSEIPFKYGETDFCLIDRFVITAFVQMGERRRLTRGLINWLGFKKEFVYFVSEKRFAGSSSFTFKRLISLALTGFFMYSFLPLRLAGYMGIFITLSSGLLGFFILVQSLILGDPLGLKITGTAMLAVLILFLVGVILSCIGLLSFYIQNIHGEVVGRPLYIIKNKKNI